MLESSVHCSLNTSITISVHNFPNSHTIQNSSPDITLCRSSKCQPLQHSIVGIKQLLFILCRQDIICRWFKDYRLLCIGLVFNLLKHMSSPKYQVVYEQCSNQ